METLRLSCPECRATLELPQSAVGRRARCPACQSTFRVDEESSDAAVSTPPVETFTGAAPAAPSKPPFGDNSWAAPDAYPPKSPANPYAVDPAMASASAEAVPEGEIVIRTASIDDIVSVSASIFSRRWQPLVIAGLILFGCSVAAGVASWGVTSAVAAAPGISVTAVTLISHTLIGFVSYYLTVGVMKVALAVARGREVTAAETFISPAVFGRVLLPVVVLVLLGTVARWIALRVASEAETLAGIFASVAVSVGSSFIVALLLLLIWPLFYVACDGRAANLSAVALGLRIGIRNLINSLFLVVIALVLGLASIVTCGVASIVTHPILLLLGAVAYLQMTSQPVSDPDGMPAESPAHPYGSA